MEKKEIVSPYIPKSTNGDWKGAQLGIYKATFGDILRENEGIQTRENEPATKRCDASDEIDVNPCRQEEETPSKIV